MSSIEPVIPAALRDRRAGTAVLLPVFATTLFVSATLLFAVQPMFTKMVLPLLGGSPAVWSVAMVFFQAVLLLGYLYAHALTRWLDPRQAVVLHLAVLAAAFFTLPIGVARGMGMPPSEGAAVWLIALFAASIGLPFFAVAANAPMLQAWFARTGHAQARDPYFLYGASNLGSFAALLAYPLVLEPIFTLRDQAHLWSAGFIALIVLIGAAGALLALRMRDGAAAVTVSSPISARAPAWRDRLAWTALAFVPSALLVAVTSHISTDIAAAPFLWVVPLALFLATFVFTFRAGGDAVHRWMLRLQPFVAAPLAVGLMGGERAYWLAAILLDLGMFFISAMICHRELYGRRPETGRLTEFYLWVSVGGVLGGMFAGLLAPNLFPDVWEYPILVVLALMCRPALWNVGRPTWLREGALIGAAIVLVSVPGLLLGAKLPAEAELAFMAVLVALAAVIMLQADRPVRLVALTALVLVATAIYQPGIVRTETARSFFGVHKVVESYDGRFRILYHGTTIHGAQQVRDEAGRPLAGRPAPLTYFYAGGPYSEAVAALRASRGRLERVAVVGLGTGTLACHAAPGEHWRYYEIDLAVVRIARDESKFTFLSSCAPATAIVLGDARLTLAAAEANHDLIILDAFTSDAIPVHLMTREAMALYLGKLAGGGAIVFNISNRYLEMASVVGAVAATHGLVTFIKQDTAIGEDEFRRTMRANALIAVVARREEDLAGLQTYEGWQRYRAERPVHPWTDDYSNILSAIWRMQWGR